MSGGLSLRSKFAIYAFGVFISLFLLIFYNEYKNIEFKKSKKEQTEILQKIQFKIDDFIAVSKMISRFIQEDISGKKLTKKEVEQKLNQYLRSTSQDVIFGIGIWYEPYRFINSQKLFGPYIHRNSIDDKKSNFTLTYEWSTEDYDYPTQSWYKLGFGHRGESFFVDPYFDNGLVYVTNSRLFYDQNNMAAGVISVDLVISQLQKIISPVNLNDDDEVIFITNRVGQLLAHSQKENYFQSKNLFDGKDNISLLNFTPLDVDHQLGLDSKNRISSTYHDDELGWEITIQSKQEHFNHGILKIRKAFLAAFIILWMLLYFVDRVIQLRIHEKNENRRKTEENRLHLVQKSKMAALGEMAGGVAHEINNPLSVIIGSVQIAEKYLISKGFHDEIIQKNFDKIIRSSERISKIIKGLRTFSRSGEQDPKQSESVGVIFNDTLALCSEKFKNLGIELIVDKIPDSQVLCRPTQISQVILNLLSNAMDAVEHSEKKWVKVSFENNEIKKMVFIIIEDSGHGIPTEVAERMMEPFFTTKAVGKGTGIGLSISKSITDDHQGTLVLDRSSAHTRFILGLPLYESV